MLNIRVFSATALNLRLVPGHRWSDTGDVQLRSFPNFLVHVLQYLVASFIPESWGITATTFLQLVNDAHYAGYYSPCVDAGVGKQIQCSAELWRKIIGHGIGRSPNGKISLDQPLSTNRQSEWLWCRYLLAASQKHVCISSLAGNDEKVRVTILAYHVLPERKSGSFVHVSFRMRRWPLA